MRSARVRDETGAVLVLFALFMTAMFAMVAIVIDLGAVREDRRGNKLIADQAVSAGSSELDQNAWAAACKAYDYLVSNAPELRTGASVTYRTGADAAVSNQCSNPAAALGCQATLPSTWARLRAVSSTGAIVVEIHAGYVLPDPAYPEDTSLLSTDDGDGPCTQIAVFVSETQQAKFSAVIGSDQLTTTMRSVARLVAGDQQGQSAALVLLERHDCNVLRATGSGTKAIALAYRDATTNTYAPGVIQFDTAADGACNTGNPVISGQATSTGPSILACSIVSTFTDPSACRANVAGSPTAKSRIGVYAKQFSSVPPGYISKPYADDTYGDTDHVVSGQATRIKVDERYREAVLDLDKDAHAALCVGSWPGCTTRTVPKDCSTVDATGHCTGATTGQWRVVSGAACTSPLPDLSLETAVFFDCGDLNVTSDVVLPVATDIVINGKLSIGGATFSAPVAARTYVLGKSSGPRIGLDVGTGGTLRINQGMSTTCTDRTALAEDATSRFVLVRGSFDVRAALQTCSTTVLLSSGFAKVPTTNGTAPCPSPENVAACDGYQGIINVTAGASVDWTAPNSEKTVPACPQLAPSCYDPTDPATELEDLALWVEAAGGGSGIGESGISGGAGTTMAGVYFLPNANRFTLAGGGSLPIELNAQFVARKLTVTGGAVIALSPNPIDSVSLPIFTNVLIR